MNDERDLDELAKSVADRSKVDWEKRLAGLEDQSTQELVEQLRVIDSLAQVHGVTGDEVDASLPFETWGHLRLERFLGAGSFGAVYLAWDEVLHRRVALKLLRDRSTGAAGSPPEASGVLVPNSPDSNSIEPVLEEARRLARVRHPNVVDIHGAERHHGIGGFWMEWVEGCRLDRRVEDAPLEVDEVIRIGTGLASALAAVHAAGLLHRDVKAQNVMVETDGRVVLMDIGAGLELEKLEGRSAPDGLGTPLYAAPELLYGESPTTAADLYALGSLMFFLLTRRFPVEGADLAEIRLNHAGDVRNRLFELRPELADSQPAEELCSLIDELLDPEPESRLEVAADLENRLSSLPRTAASRSRRSRRWIPAFVVAAAILASVSWFRGGDEPPPESLRVGVPPTTVADPGEDEWVGRALTAELRNAVGTGYGDYIDVVVMPPLDEVESEDEFARLDVDFILETTFQRDGGEIRIHATLLEGESRLRRAGFSYDRPFARTFDVQRELARTVARELQLELGDDRIALSSRLEGISPEAMELYMRGRYGGSDDLSYNEEIEARIKDLQRVIELEPEWATGHAAMAYTWNAVGFGNRYASPDSAYPLAFEAASRALELDPAEPKAHAALGYYHMYYTWDWEASRAALRAALEANPDHVNGHFYLGQLLMLLSENHDGIAHFKRAAELHPLATGLLGLQQFYLCVVGRCDEALEIEREIMLHEPDTDPTGAFWNHLAGCDADAEAMDFYDQYVNVDSLIAGANQARDPEYAEAHLEEVRDQPDGGWRILAYTRAKDWDGAMELLERRLDSRSLALPFIVNIQSVEPLYDDPRFIALMDSLGLPIPRDRWKNRDHWDKQIVRGRR